MEKHIFVLLTLLMVLSSCCISPRYDDLVIYTDDYTHGFSAQLRFDGFYYTVDTGRLNPDYIGYVHPIFFYPDGSVAYGVWYKDMSTLLAAIPNIPVFWGFYQVDNNRIQFETVVPPDVRICSTEVTVDTATLSKDLLTIIDEVDNKGRPTKHRKYYIGSQYRFYPYDIKPDSANNWIRLHKNYRLTK